MAKLILRKLSVRLSPGRYNCANTRSVIVGESNYGGGGGGNAMRRGKRLGRVLYRAPVSRILDTSRA